MPACQAVVCSTGEGKYGLVPNEHRRSRPGVRRGETERLIPPGLRTTLTVPPRHHPIIDRWHGGHRS